MNSDLHQKDENKELTKSDKNKFKFNSKLKTSFKWILLSLSALFIVLILFLVILFHTEMGLKIARKTTNYFVPALKIETMSGTLNHLTLNNLSYKDSEIEIDAKLLQLSFSISSIFKGSLIIDELQANDAITKIKTMPSNKIETESEAISKPTLIKLPISIFIKKASFNQIKTIVDDSVYELIQFESQLNWQGSQLTVNSLQINGFNAILPVLDVKQAQKAEKKKIAAAKALNKNQNNKIDIKQMIDDLFAEPFVKKMPNLFVPLNIKVLSAEFTKINFEQPIKTIETNDIHVDHYSVQSLNLKASLINQLLTIEQQKTTFSSPLFLGEVNVLGQIDFSKQWQSNLNLRGHFTEIKNQDIFDINYQVNGSILAKSNHTLKIKGLNDIDINAEFDLSKPFLPSSLELKSSHLQWPLFAKQPEFIASETLFNFSGLLNDYKLLMQSQVESASTDFNKLDYFFELNGTDEELNLKNLKLLMLPRAKNSSSAPSDILDSNGYMTLQAAFNWQDLFNWKAHWTFDRFDLSQFSQNLSTKLNGELKNQGFIDLNHLENWNFLVEELDIKGSIKQKTMLLKGNLSVNPERIESNGFGMQWGNNKINLFGDTQTNFNAGIHLNALNLFNSSLSGHINGELDLKGQLKQYELNSNLNIQQLKMNDLKLANLTFKNKLVYENNAYATDFKINGQKFSSGNIKLDKFNISLNGKESSHYFDLDVHSNLLDMLVKIDGRFNPERTNWNGAIKTINLNQKTAGAWHLNKEIPIDIQIDKKQASIGDFCIVNKEQKLCLDETAQIGQSGQVKFGLQNFKLGPYLNEITKKFKLEGAIDLNANMNWDQSMVLPEIKADLNSNKIKITELITLHKKSKVLETLNADINLNDQKATLNLDILLNQLGKIQNKVIIDDPLGKKLLSGNIDIDDLSLQLLDLFLIDDERIKGNIDGHLELAGDLNKPKINGELDLDIDTLKLVQFQTNVDAIKTKLQFLGNKSSLNGTITSPSGNIDITGTSNWADIENWTSDVMINGGPIEIKVPDMATIMAEPNLKLQASAEVINIKGKVTVPKANIDIKSLPPTVVNVSDDVVMLNENLVEIAPEQLPIPINVGVLLVLGDEVVIDAYDVKANLTGKLSIVQTAKGITGNGKITIPSGRYHAYGQDLTIRKGDLIFAGPLNNPNVNIEAIRNPESIENNVTAGIRITGFTNRLAVDVFSEPAMSQQEALSYLFTGQGFDSGSQSQNDMMAALLIGFSASQSGEYLGKFGSLFGVKDLSIDTVGVGNDQKIVMSGFVDPRLQLKYSIGIFDAIAKYTMRYRLMPSLYLEASSSIEQAIDFIYQFEF